MQDKKGFLLAECMVVFALSILLASLAFSFIGVFERLLLVVEIDLLINTIEAQRAIAVMDNKDVAIAFDPKDNAYIVDQVRHVFSPMVNFVCPPNGHGPPSAPTELIQKPISFLQNQLLCFSNGAMSSGVLYIGSIKRNYFYALSSSIGEWGVLRLYVYNQGKWFKI